MSSKEVEKRFEVHKLRQRGLSQSAIAAALGISQQQVSLICQQVDDALMLGQMVAAEEQPVTKTGNANVDALQEQIKALQCAQARFLPSSAEYLKRSELISWQILKCETLRRGLAPKERSRYIYTAVIPKPPKPPTVEPLDPTSLSPDLLLGFEESHRVARVQCKCGSDVWVSVHQDLSHLELRPPVLLDEHYELPTTAIDLDDGDDEEDDEPQDSQPSQ